MGHGAFGTADLLCEAPADAKWVERSRQSALGELRKPLLPGYSSPECGSISPPQGIIILCTELDLSQGQPVAGVS